MKHLTTFILSAIVLIGLTLTQVSYSQDDPQGKPQNRGQVKPNFVDENGDGICDKNTTGTCTGGQAGKAGQGQGNGAGARLHKQLRDGSCGQTPKQDGTGNTNSARGQARRTAPAK